jgi:hypothetical protein
VRTRRAASSMSSPTSRPANSAATSAPPMATGTASM